MNEYSCVKPPQWGEFYHPRMFLFAVLYGPPVFPSQPLATTDLFTVPGFAFSRTVCK